MVVDFAKVSVQEQPLLILQNLDDTPIGVLKATFFDAEANLCYNEISRSTEVTDRGVKMRVLYRNIEYQ